MPQNRNKPEIGILKTNYKKKKVDKQGVKDQFKQSTSQTLSKHCSVSDSGKDWNKLQNYGKQAMEVHKVEEWCEGPVKAKESSRADLRITVLEKITSIHSSITIPCDCGILWFICHSVSWFSTLWCLQLVFMQNTARGLDI